MDSGPLRLELQKSDYAPLLEAHEIHRVIDLLNASSLRTLPATIPALRLIAQLPRAYFGLDRQWREWLQLLANNNASVPSAVCRDLFSAEDLEPFMQPASRMEMLYGAGVTANIANVQSALSTL